MRLSTAIVLATLLLAAPTVAEGQSVMLDCTGSMANHEKLEASLITALANVTPLVTAFDMCLFSTSALGAGLERIGVDREKGKSRIEYVNKSREIRLRDEIKVRLEALLATRRPEPAQVTNLAAVLTRSDTENHPTLVVTDAKDETGRRPAKVGAGVGVFIVLCPAKKDNPARELETFESRKQVVNRMLPAAGIYGCHQLQQAVRGWASMATGISGLIRVSRQTR